MSRLVRPCFLFVFVIAVCFYNQGMAAVNSAATEITWGYKGHIGPEFWGQLSPRFKLCGEGKLQSPINISKNDVEVANTLILHYQPAPLVLMEDGATRLVIGAHQTLINDGHAVQVNFYGQSVKESIQYAGETYQLVQFHFHSASENQMNGESTPLEIHFVHQGNHGKVVVIGVLVKGGRANEVLQTILDHLPQADGREHVISSLTINPGSLFPLDNDYYSFWGSLTTPPCSEELQWVVMASMITASPAQIAAMRKALGGGNMRSVQPLNNRIIAYAKGTQS